MAWHYHEWICPYCGAKERVGCALGNCTTAETSKEPFIRRGYVAQLTYCMCGGAYYLDAGNHVPKKEKAVTR